MSKPFSAGRIPLCWLTAKAAPKVCLAAANLDLIFGIAAFTGPKEITVTKEDGSAETMTADHIFLNNGAHPAIPPIPGLADVPYLTSSSILDLHAIPSHLAIIGGGYVSLEFGQLYRRLGSKVTIIETGNRFLPHEDDDIAAEIRHILEEDGIQILIGTSVVKVSPGDGIRLELSGGAIAANPPGPGDRSLSCAGRYRTAARYGGPQYGCPGIRLDQHGYVIVNGRLETNVPGIFALGDVRAARNSHMSPGMITLSVY